MLKSHTFVTVDVDSLKDSLNHDNDNKIKTLHKNGMGPIGAIGPIIIIIIFLHMLSFFFFSFFFFFKLSPLL